MGADNNISIVLRELRNPLLIGNNDHPVVIFGDMSPNVYGPMKHSEYCRDVYFVQGNLSDPDDFEKLNLEHAFSMTILSSVIGQENDDEKLPPDAYILFSYFRITRSILSETLFFSVELRHSYNMYLLNRKVIGFLQKYKNSKEHELKGKPELRFVVRNKFKEVIGSGDLSISDSDAPRSGELDGDFWDITRQPESLPIYASGKAFVAGAFDSLLALVNFYRMHILLH